MTSAAPGTVQYQPYQWAKQALERLSQDKLAPAPNNYALFYYYYAGSNPRLKMALDACLEEHAGILNQDACNELFQTHLGVEAEHRAIKETNAAIEMQVSRVLDAIDKASSGTSAYSKTLDAFSGQLTHSASLDQIRGAVTKMVDETRGMVKQNERLAQQLTQTTQQLSEVQTRFEQVHKESQVDPLTEIGNRKFFDRELSHTIAEARDNGTPLTLLMADIDHFKKFNDTYGHLIGDQVLRLVARTLVENLKGRDIIARYGGEEFVILLPQTRIVDAEKVANQLRVALGNKQIKRRATNETLGSATISIGAAEYCVGEEVEHFVGRADAALYKAKQTGRNRVVPDILTEAQIAAIKAQRRAI